MTNPKYAIGQAVTLGEYAGIIRHIADPLDGYDDGHNYYDVRFPGAKYGVLDVPEYMLRAAPHLNLPALTEVNRAINEALDRRAA